MKRFLSLVIIILVTQNAFAQINTWRWQNPSNQGSTLNAVQMINLKKTFACGNRGTIIKTTDAGITWDIKNLLLGDSLNLYALNFLDSNHGMMCGDTGLIFKTIDGGNTWSQLVTSTKVPLKGICLIDTNVALAVGHNGTVLRTVDGGINWVSVPFEIAAEFTSIRKLRPDFITVTARQGLVYKSTDQGSNWKQLVIKSDTTIIGNDIDGQVFYDDNNAIVVGDLGGIFSTTDGGNTWAIRSSSTSVILNAIDVKDPNGNLYAIVGDFGTILNSTNNGQDWNKVDLGISDSMKAISFFDRFNAFAVGRDGVIIKTTDGGISWAFIPSRPLTDKLNSIAFPKGDTSLGIAVGYWGAIMRTTNGGAHWDLIPSGTTYELSSVTFLNSFELCAVGQHGTIIKSYDAGVSWVPRGSGTSKFLKSVTFPTPFFGWAAGDSGIVLSTTDGGNTWIPHPFSKRRSFTGIAFPDSIHGYMSCDHGLYFTTDAGVTWQDPDDITYYLHCTDVCSPSANVVSFIYWPCDPAGSAIQPLPPAGIMTSHDGGKNWFNKQFNVGDLLQPLLSCVFFADDLHGTASGIYYPNKQPIGYITHTTDGGMSWTQQDSHTTYNLFGVAFGTVKAGTAVGLRGNIMRITTDE